MPALLRTRPAATAIVAFAAALWGTDALFRRPLAHSIGVSTIVFGEHAVLVLVALPFMLPSLRAVARLGWRYLLAAVVIGAGASALATILFTQAFVDGDPVTPVVIQKIQPIVAVLAARLVLGERPRQRFAWYLLPALAGTWLMAFPSPSHLDTRGALLPALYAVAAAVLWALGTVLGRYLSRVLPFQQVTALRFAFGLPASAVALVVLGQPAVASAHDSLWIAVLALVTGAIALSLYYFGLRNTPAVAATIAELAFPVTAAIVGYLAFGARLTSTQWAGVAVTTLVVALLPARPRGTVVLPATVPAAAAA
ncbi:MAG: DMT family transporter [Gaiellaceae bacterium]